MDAAIFHRGFQVFWYTPLNADSGGFSDRDCTLDPGSVCPADRRSNRSSSRCQRCAAGEGRRSPDLCLHRYTVRTQVGSGGSGCTPARSFREHHRKPFCGTNLEAGRWQPSSGRAGCKQARSGSEFRRLVIVESQSRNRHRQTCQCAVHSAYRDSRWCCARIWMPKLRRHRQNRANSLYSHLYVLCGEIVQNLRRDMVVFLPAPQSTCRSTFQL